MLRCSTLDGLGLPPCRLQVGFALVFCQALQPVILDPNTEDSTRREVNRALAAMAGDVANLVVDICFTWTQIVFCG